MPAGTDRETSRFRISGRLRNLAVEGTAALSLAVPIGGVPHAPAVEPVGTGIINTVPLAPLPFKKQLPLPAKEIINPLPFL